jgi:hypothetical protein
MIICCAEAASRKDSSRLQELAQNLNTGAVTWMQVVPQPVSRPEELLDVQLLFERCKIIDCLHTLSVWAAAFTADDLS